MKDTTERSRRKEGEGAGSINTASSFHTQHVGKLGLQPSERRGTDGRQIMPWDHWIRTSARIAQLDITPELSERDLNTPYLLQSIREDPPRPEGSFIKSTFGRHPIRYLGDHRRNRGLLRPGIWCPARLWCIRGSVFSGFSTCVVCKYKSVCVHEIKFEIVCWCWVLESCLEWEEIPVILSCLTGGHASPYLTLVECGRCTSGRETGENGEDNSGKNWN
jgi:hypothetical protein